MPDTGRVAGITGTATIAVTMMLVANLLFATVDTTTKWLLELGYASMQLAFFRYVIQFLITSVDLVRHGAGRLRAARSRLGILLLRASLLVATTIANFIALRYLSLSVTSAIMFSAPIIVCALSASMLGERVGPYRWSFVFLGFLGVLIVIRPFGQDIEWAAFLMLGSAVGLALYSILTRRIARDIDPAVMQFVLGVLGTVVLAPLAWLTWVPPTAGVHWLLMVLIGAFAWLGHELLIRAHKIAPANYLMPYTYSYLIYMMIGSLLVFQDVPTGWTLLGAAMIAASGVLIWWRSEAVENVATRS